MDSVDQLAQDVLAQNPNLQAIYQGGDAVAYYLAGLMMRQLPGLPEGQAFESAKRVLEQGAA